jgi:hypothetical protein
MNTTELKSIRQSLSNLRDGLKKEAFRLNSDLEPGDRDTLQGVGMDVSAASMNLKRLIEKLEEGK